MFLIRNYGLGHNRKDDAIAANLWTGVDYRHIKQYLGLAIVIVTPKIKFLCTFYELAYLIFLLLKGLHVKFYDKECDKMQETDKQPAIHPEYGDANYKKISMSIKTKMIAYISFLILLVVVVITVPATYYFSQSLSIVNSKNAEQGVIGLKNELERRENDAIREVTVLSMNSALIAAVNDKDSDAIIRVLAPIVKENGMDVMTVTDEKGTVITRIHDKAKGDNISNQANVQSALKGTVFGAIEEGPIIKLSARAGAPVKDEQGRIIGVISGGYDATKDAFVDNVKKMYGTDVTLFLGDERVATTLIKDDKRVIGTKLNEQIAALVLGQGQKYNARADILGMDYFTSYLPLIGKDNKIIGVLFAGESTAEVIAERNRMMLIIGLISLLVLGFGAICARFIAGKIANPLHTMLVNVQEVASGNLSVQKISLTSSDEIGQLSAAFNGMTENLKSLIQQVNQATDQVASSSEELTASAEQSAQAAGQVADAANAVAASAEQQLSAISETSCVVEQISAGIQQVAASANQVADSSLLAAETAKNGDQSVNNAVSQMVHIEQTVNSSAKVVAKLGERSKEIGQIVDAISGIAGQTNLLALNAAIEAARAGEQGKGFSVVAEEVRKLAEQSQNAAKQISNLVSEIQGDTDKAVLAMGEGTREVKMGADVVAAAGRAFKEITALVTQVSEQVKEISASIQQIASGSQQIVEAVKKIDEHGKIAVSQSQTVSAATEEQSATVEEIAASSKSLAQLAHGLQVSVGKFRISEVQ